MKRLAWLAAVVLPLFASACVASSDKFVEESLGFSTTKGRVVLFNELGSHEMQHLSDGIAITVTEPGCQVTVDFGDETSRQYEVQPGSILVFGGSNDFILEPQLKTTPTTPSSAQPTP